MKIGDRVRITDKVSCFKGREGTIKDNRGGPLPWGVHGVYANKFDSRALVWFHEREMEVL